MKKIVVLFFIVIIGIAAYLGRGFLIEKFNSLTSKRSDPSGQPADQNADSANSYDKNRDETLNDSSSSSSSTDYQPNSFASRKSFYKSSGGQADGTPEHKDQEESENHPESSGLQSADTAEKMEQMRERTRAYFERKQAEKATESGAVGGAEHQGLFNRNEAEAALDNIKKEEGYRPSNTEYIENSSDPVPDYPSSDSSYEESDYQTEY